MKDDLDVIARARALLRETFGADVQLRGIETSPASDGEPARHWLHAVPADRPNAPLPIIGMDASGRHVHIERPDDVGARTSVEPAGAPPLNLIAGSPATVTFVPSSTELTLAKGELERECVNVAVPRPRRPKLDVYLLADLTGSMTHILGYVTSAAKLLVDRLSGLDVDLAMGIGGYRDFPAPENLVFERRLPITPALALVQLQLSAWKADSDHLTNDRPEAQLFALDRIAENDGIGWRRDPQVARLVVWFGDAPGHEPLCQDLTKLPYAITTASVAGKLKDRRIRVVAMNATVSASTALDDVSLDSDPRSDAVDHLPFCPVPGGEAGQATAIANATGGAYLPAVAGGDLVTTIERVIADASTPRVSLRATGDAARFVHEIRPASQVVAVDHPLTFSVDFVGADECRKHAHTVHGSLEVLVDDVVVGAKPITITVPACPSADRPQSAEHPRPPPAECTIRPRYVMRSSPSAVTCMRTTSGHPEINALFQGADGQLLRAYNAGPDPFQVTGWRVENLERPGGASGATVDGAPFAMMSSQPHVDPNIDVLRGLVTDSHAALHDRLHTSSGWMPWIHDDRPHSSVSIVDAPTAVRVRRTFRRGDDDDAVFDSDDQIMPFVWGSDGKLYRYYNGWRLHGSPGVDLAGPPVGLWPMSAIDTKPYVFAVCSDGRLYVHHPFALDAEVWIWWGLGWSASAIPLRFWRRPAVVAARNGPASSAHVFCPTASGLALHTWVGFHGLSPAPVTIIDLDRPSPTVSVESAATAVAVGDGSGTDHVWAFVRGSDDRLWMRGGFASTLQGRWASLGAPDGVSLRGDPSATVAVLTSGAPIYPHRDPICVFAWGSDDQLHFCHVSADGRSHGWITIA